MQLQRGRVMTIYELKTTGIPELERSIGLYISPAAAYHAKYELVDKLKYVYKDDTFEQDYTVEVVEREVEDLRGRRFYYVIIDEEVK